MRAFYTDNEGHAIEYGGSLSPDGLVATFTSDFVSGAARYRLTYTLLAADSVSIRFETAPPDAPDSLKTYIVATAHRVKK